MNELRLNSFLRFGYFLDYQNRDYRFDLSLVNKERYSAADEPELVRLAAAQFREAVVGQFSAGSDNVVPLSGGLDSRAILGVLLECTDARNIFTYTFGSPGTLDYEIGNLVAQRIGTRHTSIPLSEHRYSMDELLKTSRRTDHQTVLFATVPLFIVQRLFGAAVHWSGAFAGTPTGNVLPDNPSRDTQEARQRFIDHKYTHVKSCRLAACTDGALHTLLELEWLDPQLITYDEQLHLEFAQLRWIAPHVLMRGFKYRTPFLEPKWLGLMFGTDNRLRYGQCLYKTMLLTHFPKLFAYKTKSHRGLPLGAGRLAVALGRVTDRVTRFRNRHRGAPDPRVNYIDFAAGIRAREDLRKIIYENIMDLRERKLVDWIDLEAIWERHQDGKADHSDALLVLASLEIHLKAQGS